MDGWISVHPGCSVTGSVCSSFSADRLSEFSLLHSHAQLSALLQEAEGHLLCITRKSSEVYCKFKVVPCEAKVKRGPSFPPTVTSDSRRAKAGPRGGVTAGLGSPEEPLCGLGAGQAERWVRAIGQQQVALDGPQGGQGLLRGPAACCPEQTAQALWTLLPMCAQQPRTECGSVPQLPLLWGSSSLYGPCCPCCLCPAPGPFPPLSMLLTL